MEIRRSLMRRPNLSVRSTLEPFSPDSTLRTIASLVLAKGEERSSQFDCAGNRKTKRGETSSTRAPRFLSKHGRRGRFPPHPRSQLAEHRRRNPGYAFRLRRSETVSQL